MLIFLISKLILQFVQTPANSVGLPASYNSTQNFKSALLEQPSNTNCCSSSSASHTRSHTPAVSVTIVYSVNRPGPTAQNSEALCNT